MDDEVGAVLADEARYARFFAAFSGVDPAGALQRYLARAELASLAARAFGTDGDPDAVREWRRRTEERDEVERALRAVRDEPTPAAAVPGADTAPAAPQRRTRRRLVPIVAGILGGAVALAVVAAVLPGRSWSIDEDVPPVRLFTTAQQEVDRISVLAQTPPLVESTTRRLAILDRPGATEALQTAYTAIDQVGDVCVIVYHRGVPLAAGCVSPERFVENGVTVVWAPADGPSGELTWSADGALVAAMEA